VNPMKLDKQQTITISWSTIVSIASAVGAVWAFAGPLAEHALAGEIQKQLEKQIAPLQQQQAISQSQQQMLIQLQKTQLQTNIRNLKNQIAALMFKKDMCAGAPKCWELPDVQALVAAQADLNDAEMVLAAISGGN